MLTSLSWRHFILLGDVIPWVKSLLLLQIQELDGPLLPFYLCDTKI